MGNYYIQSDMDDTVEIGPGLGWVYKWQVEQKWEIDWGWYDEIVRDDEERMEVEQAEEAARKANLLIDFEEPVIMEPPEPPRENKFEKDLLELFSGPSEVDEGESWGEFQSSPP